MRQFFINLLWYKENFSYAKEGVVINFTVWRRPWKSFDSEEVRVLLRDSGWEYHSRFME